MALTDIVKNIYGWWTQKSQRDLLLETIANARQFEEWEAAAYKLDECLDYDMWYVYHNTSKHPPLTL
jgi:TAG lipase / lysophosphatidylethanolamine acyltransferase